MYNLLKDVWLTGTNVRHLHFSDHRTRTNCLDEIIYFHHFRPTLFASDIHWHESIENTDLLLVEAIWLDTFISQHYKIKPLIAKKQQHRLLTSTMKLEIAANVTNSRTREIRELSQWPLLCTEGKIPFRRFVRWLRKDFHRRPCMMSRVDQLTRLPPLYQALPCCVSCDPESRYIADDSKIDNSDRDLSICRKPSRSASSIARMWHGKSETG